jgi:diaminopimelate decarboxylase
MDLFDLIASQFGVSNGELKIGDLVASAIAEKYQTPLFIYNAHLLDRKLALLRDTFPREFSIFYSVKANPNLAILKFFVARECGLEIASEGEFRLALKAGCPPEKIMFAGPGKTEAELEFVLRNGVGEIHLESLLEAKRIAKISQETGIRARVGLRINPSAEAQGGAMRMGGKPVPFGIDEENLDGALDCVLSEPSIDFRGIHLFVGTQILDHRLLTAQYRKGLEIAFLVAKRIKRPLHTVDFGGGLGIPYFAHEQELDMEKLKADLLSLMSEVRAIERLAGTRFVIEPGRYLVGDAGVYVTRINDIKISRGKKFLIVDGGMHHHLAASGNLGQVIKRNFPVALLNKLGEKPKDNVDIVGPLCTPLDVLAREVTLPEAEVGDLIGVFQSGAYARTASPLGFLSHPTPAEVLVCKNTVRLIRRRGRPNDLFNDLV